MSAGAPDGSGQAAEYAGGAYADDGDRYKYFDERVAGVGGSLLA
jgi:hypothetical protein